MSWKLYAVSSMVGTTPAAATIHVGTGTAVQELHVALPVADLVPEERYSKRLKLKIPVLDAFLVWGNIRNASSKSSSGVALTYLNN